MKVLLLGNYAPDGHTSMLAFNRLMARELPGAGCEVRIIAPPLRLARVSTNSRWWKWLGYIDKYVLFVPAIRRHLRWADVVHVCDHSNGMYVRWVRSKPNLITCHDVIAIQAARGMVEGWKVGWTGRQFQRLITEGLASADLVACDSDLTRRDLLALGGGVEERRAATIPLGLNDDFAPVPPAEARQRLARFGFSADDRYLMHVGWDLDRKNRRTVVKAFIALQRRAAERGTPAPVQTLVFVGPPLAPDMAALAREAGVADRIRTVMKISHDELCAIYSSATALLFPSLQEGFGWPVIEAQASGCPVFASDLAPMNEIGGEAAVYVAPLDPEAIAHAIEQAAPRLADMRTLGLQNAAHFSAARMAANYVSAYRRVIDEKAGASA